MEIRLGHEVMWEGGVTVQIDGLLKTLQRRCQRRRIVFSKKRVEEAAKEMSPVVVWHSADNAIDVSLGPFALGRSRFAGFNVPVVEHLSGIVQIALHAVFQIGHGIPSVAPRIFKPGPDAKQLSR